MFTGLAASLHLVPLGWRLMGGNPGAAAERGDTSGEPFT
jgi:hypothetical protein